MPSEPILVNAALVAIGLLLLWAVRELHGLRDLVRDIHAIVTDKRTGLTTAVDQHEERLDDHDTRLDGFGRRLHALDGEIED